MRQGSALLGSQVSHNLAHLGIVKTFRNFQIPISETEYESNRENRYRIRIRNFEHWPNACCKGVVDWVVDKCFYPGAT